MRCPSERAVAGLGPSGLNNSNKPIIITDSTRGVFFYRQFSKPEPSGENINSRVKTPTSNKQFIPELVTFMEILRYIKVTIIIINTRITHPQIIPEKLSYKHTHGQHPHHHTQVCTHTYTHTPIRLTAHSIYSERNTWRSHNNQQANQETQLTWPQVLHAQHTSVGQQHQQTAHVFLPVGFGIQLTPSHLLAQRKINKINPSASPRERLLGRKSSHSRHLVKTEIHEISLLVSFCLQTLGATSPDSSCPRQKVD